MIEQSLSVRRRVTASPDQVYEAVSDLARMAAWSDEYVGSWRFYRHAPRPGARFVGWNRKGWRLWFTTCRVVSADGPSQFAFESGFLGMPVARWSYGILATADGGSEVVGGGTTYAAPVRSGLSPDRSARYSPERRRSSGYAGTRPVWRPPWNAWPKTSRGFDGPLAPRIPVDRDVDMVVMVRGDRPAILHPSPAFAAALHGPDSL